LIDTARKIEEDRRKIRRKIEEYRLAILKDPKGTGEALATQPELLAEILNKELLTEILSGRRDEYPSGNAAKARGRAVAAALTNGSGETYVTLAKREPNLVRGVIRRAIAENSLVQNKTLWEQISDSPEKLRVALAAMKGETAAPLQDKFAEFILSNMNEKQYSTIANSPEALEGLAVVAAGLAHVFHENGAVQRLREAVAQLLTTEAGRNVLKTEPPSEWPRSADQLARKE
jgi:hypothetical protein